VNVRLAVFQAPQPMWRKRRGHADDALGESCLTFAQRKICKNLARIAQEENLQSLVFATYGKMEASLRAGGRHNVSSRRGFAQIN
jgi:hypothetical protein